MQPIIYDVAVSIDGYISGPDDDVSIFAPDGPVVTDYQNRLETYACAIMGRATYEFGYRFGMRPGDNPYSHMQTIVFSDSMKLPETSDVSVLGSNDLDAIRDLRKTQTGPIYLCGGGQFAGALLEQGLIDIVRLKRAPGFLGSGTRLFGAAAIMPKLKCTETKVYADGYLYQEYARSALAQKENPDGL